MPIRIPVHLQSRDVLRADAGCSCAQASTETRAREFYRRVIMGNELGENKLLEACGLLVTVHFPRRVLEAKQS